MVVAVLVFWTVTAFVF